MREIEFRAWDKKKKIMVYGIEKVYDGGDLIDSKGREVDIYDLTGCPAESFSAFLENEDFEVMQYIVRKDNKGNKIYDGDICERVGCGTLYEVYWSECMDGWRMKCLDKGHFFSYRTLNGNDWKKVGNTHEKPGVD